MRLINFIMFYQFFDALEVKLHDALNQLCSYTPDRMSIEQVQELHDLKIKIKFLREIYCNLSEFIIDL